MVIPDRVMQGQRLVAGAPLVARTRILIDNEGWNAELLQTRAQTESTLAAANNDDIRLFGYAELSLFLCASLQPGTRHSAMICFNPTDPTTTERFFESLEFPLSGHQCPAKSVAQTDMALAAPQRCFESQERVDFFDMRPCLLHTPAGGPGKWQHAP